MKKLLTLFTLLLTVCSGAWGDKGDILFSQSFDATGAGSIAYNAPTSSTPSTRNVTSLDGIVGNGNNLFTSIACSIKKGDIAINSSTGGNSVNATGIFQVYSNGDNAGYWSINRTSAFAGTAPKAIQVSMDIWYDNLGSGSDNQIQFAVGNEFTDGLTNSIQSASKVHSGFAIYGNSNATIKAYNNSSTAVSNTALTQETWLSITWVINNSGETLTYDNPTGSGKSELNNDCYDLWLKTQAGLVSTYTKIATNIAATTASVDLQNFYVGNKYNKKHEFRLDNVKVTDLTPSVAPALPTLTGAWKIGEDEETSANVIQGGSVTIPTFTVGATSGTPDAGDYTVTYSLKDGSATNIFTFTESGGPTEISTANVGTATLVATLTTKDASKYLTPATNTFEYTVTVNAPAAPTFDPGAGNFASGTAITMTSPDGGEIWYTTSGDDPTESNKTVYDAEAKPTLTGATTIKAIARVNGYSSAVTTADYTVFSIYEQTDVTESTTWDWQNITSASIELSETTTPKNTDEFVLKNVEKYNDYTIAGFAGDAQQLKVIAQYPFRNDGNGKLLQGDKIQFHTTVPGYVKVTYSNTGGKDDPQKASEKRPYRYVKVNEMMSEEGSASTTKKTTEAFFVPAGDVAITGYIPDANDPYSRSGDNVGAAMLRIYKVEFTEAVPVTIGAYGYASFASTSALDFTGSGITAYIATANGTDNVTMTEIAKVPANTGVVLKGTEGTVNVPVLNGDADPTTGNLLKPGAKTVTQTEADNSYIYAFGRMGVQVGFVKAHAGFTITAGKAYLDLSGTGGAKDVEFLSFVFSDEEQGETDGIKAVSTKVENGVRYNLAGQKVGADYKGIVIVNGKKYLRK